jgi:roadblock/LC7 domain-containing protein
LICAALLALSIVAGYIFLEETHPDMQPWSTQSDLDNSTAETPLVPASGATAHAAADLRGESYGTFDQVDSLPNVNWTVTADGEVIKHDTAKSPASQRETVFTKRVIMLIISLGIFTYHCMTYDHLLPIFLEDDRVDDISAFSTLSLGDMSGGLGLSVQSVGVIMSVNGLIALFVQGLVFPLMAEWLGIWRLFIFVTIGHPVAYFIVPYLVLLPANLLYPGIYICLAVRNFFSIMQYPLLLILIKEASPSPTYLGRINGLAASVGAAARTMASPIGGELYSLGSQMNFTPLAWWASTGVALIGALQIPFLSQKKKTTTVVRPAQCKFMPPAGRERRDSVVHITVKEEEEPLLQV